MIIIGNLTVFAYKKLNFENLPRVRSQFTYYVISRGGGGFQMLTVDYGGGGGLAVDYVIKILIFTLIPI